MRVNPASLCRNLLCMEVVEDLRVVRGPDWEHGDEDGGEGHLGTVVQVHRRAEPAEATDGSAEGEGSGDGGEAAEASRPEKESGDGDGEVRSVTVQWDLGHRGVYKCGEDGKFELRILDTAQAGVMGRSITCDGCRTSPVLGIRWKCAQCYDFDLCSNCYMANQHSDGHKFVRYDKESRTMTPYRRGARSVESKGIFPGASVVRGHDWSWGQQDGGSGTVGRVIAISTWEESHYRASVEVEWPEEGKKNYRVGCQGMVDLKCVTPTSGGKYYPDHLQVLGAPHCPPGDCEFSSSDYVRVELDAEIFEMLQQNHGGWNSAMGKLRGQLGVVHSILDNGDLRVSYGANKWIINPSAVVKADVPRYRVGDVVRVMDDLAEVAKLQKNHGGWVEDMAGSVGQLGSVQGVSSDGNVAVLMKTHMWTFNPLCLRQAEKEEKQGVSSSEVLGQETQLLELRLQTLIEQEDSELLHHAALLGNLPVIKDYLDKYPNEVDAKYSGKTALHCAAAAGKLTIVETLLELGANIEAQDEEGLRALHHCALREMPEIATVLLNAGSDPNSKSRAEHTPLIVAALKGNVKVLTALLKWPTTKLSEQDKDGDTALHCSIHARRYQSLCALLEAGADPSLVNFNILTPLHLAVKVGFLPAVEYMVRSHPEHVDVRDNLQCTPLHIAASEGEVEVAKTLLDVAECLVDARAETGNTPLHGAIAKDQSRLVELLVGYGADPAIADNDGQTSLHLALDNADFHQPSENTPELCKVRELLSGMTSREVTSQMIVVCFLIREGGDVRAVSNSGQTALDSCAPDLAVVISGFAEKHAGSGKYRGSLRNPQQENSAQNLTDVENENQMGKAGAPPPTGEKEGENQSLQPAPKHPSPSDTTPSSSAGSDGVKDSATEPPPASPNTTAANPNLCFLCDLPVMVKFEPCGHSPLCQNCARRARKCPDCRTPVQGVLELQQ